MSADTPLPRRRARVTPRALLLLVLVVALLVSISYPVRQYLHHRANVIALEQEAERLDQANAALKAEIKRLEDPEYIEYLARKCLGMVRKGEIAFVTVPVGGQPSVPDC